MSYLTQKQYDRRRENAAKRNYRNELIASVNGMTEKEAELVTELCSVRHEMHTNIDSLINDPSNTLIENKLITIYNRINATSLPKLSFGKYDRVDEGYIDIENIQGLYEYDDVPEQGTQAWQNWYDENYSRIADDWENLNTIIENYLKEVDKIYDTSFAPTGALRAF